MNNIEERIREIIRGGIKRNLEVTKYNNGVSFFLPNEGLEDIKIDVREFIDEAIEQYLMIENFKKRNNK